MLTTLQQTKEYVLDRAAKIAGEEILDFEKILIEDELEDLWWEKLATTLSEDDINTIELDKDPTEDQEAFEQFEAKVFLKIPAYGKFLEEISISFLINYFDDDFDDTEEDEEK